MITYWQQINNQFAKTKKDEIHKKLKFIFNIMFNCI